MKEYASGQQTPFRLVFADKTDKNTNTDNKIPANQTSNANFVLFHLYFLLKLKSIKR